MRFGRSPQTSAYVVALVIALAICLLTASGVTNAVPVASAAPAPMVLTYSTTLGGTTFALPLSGGSVTVDWGDGTTNAQLTHTYATGGVYTVSISGTATHFGNAGYLGGSGVTAVTSFGDLGLTDLSGAFAGATHLTSVPAVLPQGVTNTSHMFAGASMFNQPIGGWNTASVTNMAGMFAGATVFNQPIGSWNTASVTNMAGMFDATGAFNQPIGGWNTAAVTNMSQMFEATGAFNQPIGTWNTAAVTGMSYMFQAATAFNQPIGTWNTARVTNMSHMFQGVWGRPPSSGGRWTIMSDFNRPIGAWKTAQVTDMSYMFEGAVRFNQPIGSWKTAWVSSMQGMFEYASAFNQPIGTWNTARVSHMSALFYGAVRFNQPIGTWTTRAATNLSWMFGNGSGLSTSNYNQLLIGWAARPQTRHVRFDAGHSTYNGAATAAHNTLHVKDGWTIVDGGRTSRKAVPQITIVPRVAPVTYPHALTNANVRGGAANTRGRFYLTQSPQYLRPGLHRVRVIFRPTDTAHYTSTATLVWVRIYPRI